MSKVKKSVSKKKRRGRPERDSEITRKQLIDASINLFLEKGFHYTSINEIVTAARTGKGTFYHFFKNKEDLFSQILTSFFNELKQTLTWTYENLEELSKNDVIHDLFFLEGQRVFITFKKYEKWGKLLFLQGRSISVDINNLIDEFFDELTKITRKTFKMGMDLGLIKMQDEHILALIVIGTVEKVYQQYLFKKIDLKEEALIQETVSILLRAVGVSS